MPTFGLPTAPINLPPGEHVSGASRHRLLMRQHWGGPMSSKPPGPYPALLTCRIAGVSFNNRQAAVEQLTSKQPVCLLPEPSNPHDQFAVSIHTMSGAQLGYVPRECNMYLHGKGALLGRVVSSGCAPNGLWGATIFVELSPLPLLPMPWPSKPQLVQKLRVMCEPHTPVWSAAMSACEGVCVATGQHNVLQDLQVVPVWVPDVQKKQVKLLCWQAVCQDAAQALQLFDHAASNPKRKKAAQKLKQLMSLTDVELNAFLCWGNEWRKEMQNNKWQLIM